MDITYLGAGGVRLVGRSIDVVCDVPTGVRAKGNVATWSAKPAAGGEELTAPEGAMVISGPGEYEVKGAMITGVPVRLHIDEVGHRGTAYSIVIDGINVVVAGNIAGKLDEGQIENLGSVDVLVVPVGGNGLTLDAEGAAAVVTQLEPSLVVPVHFDDGASRYPVPQDKVDKFLKEMGVNPEPEPRLRISQREQVPETQVVVLNRVGN